MPLRSLLLGVLLAAALSTGCGREDPKRIPANRASELTSFVDQAGRAASAGECDAAREAVLEARRSVSELPRRVDRRLEENLRGWLRQLDREIRSSCRPPTPVAEPAASATPSPTPTVTASPTPTPSSTPEATPTTTPGETIVPGTGGEEGPNEEQPPSTGVPPVEDDEDE